MTFQEELQETGEVFRAAKRSYSDLCILGVLSGFHFLGLKLQ
jgi:hypothetical protein